MGLVCMPDPRSTTAAEIEILRRLPLCQSHGPVCPTSRLCAFLHLCVPRLFCFTNKGHPGSPTTRTRVDPLHGVHQTLPTSDEGKAITPKTALRPGPDLPNLVRFPALGAKRLMWPNKEDIPPSTKKKKKKEEEEKRMMMMMMMSGILLFESC